EWDTLFSLLSHMIHHWFDKTPKDFAAMMKDTVFTDEICGDVLVQYKWKEVHTPPALVTYLQQREDTRRQERRDAGEKETEQEKVAGDNSDVAVEASGMMWRITKEDVCTELVRLASRIS